MPNKKKRSHQARMTPSLGVLRPDAAGIDIGATEMYVAVPPDRAPEPVRSFGTFTEDLHAITQWLKSCRITTVAMESTGVYWIPLYQLLESYGIEVHLVNARHVKNVPGRKTDVSDCQWLQYLHSVGLLSKSFRPADEICVVRSLLRHRADMVRSAAAHTQHMQKALSQMNLQLHHVISDITGVTGMAIIDAIVAGERNPETLARLRDRRIKADEKTIMKSLVGDYRPEHLFTLKQARASYRHFQTQIQECDKEIEGYLREFESRAEPDEPSPPTPTPSSSPSTEAPPFDLASHLHERMGTDLTLIPGINTQTVYVLFSEIGPDLSSFPTPEQFCSWLKLCPYNKITGGRVISSRTGRTDNRAAQALRLAAQSLCRSQSFLGDYFRRLRARMGSPKAITAAAHKLVRIVYHLVSTGKAYDDSIFAKEEERTKQRKERTLKNLAKQLGYQLSPAPAAG